MSKLILLTILIIFLTPALFCQEIKTNLTLDEALAIALKNNLDLQIEIQNPEIYRSLLKKSNALFIPEIKFNFSHSETSTPSSSVLTGATIDTTNSDQLSLIYSQKIPLGGLISLELRNNRYSTNSRFSSVNPRFNSQLNFSLSQPLLKNFGTLAAKKNIYITANNYKKSLQSLKLQLLNLTYAVEEAYWNFVYNKRILEVRRKSLSLAQDLLKQNEIQVKVGVSAPMDILTAKAEVASRESELLLAESQLQVSEENLRRILNVSVQNQNYEPTDEPLLPKIEIDFDKLLTQAYKSRPEILQMQYEVANKTIDKKYYRQQLLPDLNLQFSYYTTGLSGTQIIWDKSPLNPDAKIIGTIEGDIWEALKDVFANLYRNFSIQLSLAIPLSNISAMSDYKQSKLSLLQAEFNLKKVENNIYSEIKQLIKELTAYEKIVEAAKLSRELSEQKLEAEQKKLAVGVSTNYQVLQYQRDYANSLLSELKAIIDFKLAQARLDKALAISLEKHNINFVQFE